MHLDVAAQAALDQAARRQHEKRRDHWLVGTQRLRTTPPRAALKARNSSNNSAMRTHAEGVPNDSEWEWVGGRAFDEAGGLTFPLRQSYSRMHATSIDHTHATCSKRKRHAVSAQT